MAKQASHSDPDRYTDPELRDRIKAELTAGDKGGKPGQWSARKAQMVAGEYEKQGGGYKQEPDAQQNSLKQWGDEHWKTEDGEKAERPGGTTRYLPEKAWDSLSEEEKAATNRKKQEGSKKGEQFVANTEQATAATKSAKKAKPAAKKAKSSSEPAPKTKTAATGTSGSKPKSSAKKAPAKKASAKKSSTKKAASKNA